MAKIIMLCGTSESSRIMYHGLIQQGLSIDRVIMDTGGSITKMINVRRRRVGTFNTVGQLAFIALNKILAKTARKRSASIKEELAIISTPIPETAITKVESINADSVKELLAAEKPDVIIVNGTRIIRKKILNAVDCPFINTHVGITPRYRGVHGGYWALAMNDREHCGVTVHLIDEGVDTGSVLYQGTIKPTRQDSFNTYPLLQLAVAIPLMAQAIRDALRGELNPKQVDGPSKQWYHPAIWEYIWFRITRHVK